MMSSPHQKEKAVLLISLMYSQKEILPAIIAALEKSFGGIRHRSEEIKFDFTSFYENEFGRNLRKVYLLFERSFDIENLSDAKLLCHGLEKKYSINEKRTMNIDPGYMTKNSVVLASFKPRPHRIYLREGAYADLQLVFENKGWKGFPWTFSDIKSREVSLFLTQGRDVFGN